MHTCRPTHLRVHLSVRASEHTSEPTATQSAAPTHLAMPDADVHQLAQGLVLVEAASQANHQVLSEQQAGVKAAAPAPAPTPPASDPPDKFEGRYRPPTSPVGTPDSLIPSNIVGQSFNPYLAAFAGGQQNPYQSSFMAPQQQQPSSTFGGYGQQAPMFAMAPYAGLAQSQPMPIDFFPSYVPRPDPIYETVPFPMPKPQPDAEPIMVAPRRTPVMTRPSARMGAPLGRDQITEFLPYR